MLAQELGHLKKVGGVSVDGTKIKANASKNAAVSYKRAEKMIHQLELEIEQLTQKAEEIDNAPLEDGLTLPDEIKRREDRKKSLEQAYNAQAVVDTEGSMLVLGDYVTDHANDKLELNPVVKSVDPNTREIKNVSADTGYFSEAAVLELEADGQGPSVYCAVEKQSHHRTVEDLLEKEDPPTPAEGGAPVKEKMSHRLRTKEGKAIYKKRKETVEPVFGIIKSVMGFRQFYLRGLDKVNLEWNLVTLAYNFKRLHKLTGGSFVPQSSKI